MSEGMTIKDKAPRTVYIWKRIVTALEVQPRLLEALFFNNRWNGLDQQMVGAIASN